MYVDNAWAFRTLFLFFTFHFQMGGLKRVLTRQHSQTTNNHCLKHVTCLTCHWHKWHRHNKCAGPWIDPVREIWYLTNPNPTNYLCLIQANSQLCSSATIQTLGRLGPWFFISRLLHQGTKWEGRCSYYWFWCFLAFQLEVPTQFQSQEKSWGRVNSPKDALVGVELGRLGLNVEKPARLPETIVAESRLKRDVVSSAVGRKVPAVKAGIAAVMFSFCLSTSFCDCLFRDFARSLLDP